MEMLGKSYCLSANFFFFFAGGVMLNGEGTAMDIQESLANKGEW